MKIEAMSGSSSISGLLERNKCAIALTQSMVLQGVVPVLRIKGLILLLKVGHLPGSRCLLHWLLRLSRLGTLLCITINPSNPSQT